mgnify:FL=1
MIKELAKKNRSYRRFYENKKITIPRTTRTIPVALFKVLGVALFANKAAILAQTRVKRIHKIHTVKLGNPPIIKCEIAPVRAVKVIIKTLVPTAVLSSYPMTVVKIRSIIMPPPAPTKPQIKPIQVPQIIDWIALFLEETLFIASFVVITGLTINLTPKIKVIKTEKLPIVEDGKRLAA